MIRKPREDDFRENEAIVAMRETRRVAVEGSRGVGKGISRLYLWFLGGMMALGLVTSLVTTLGPSGVVLSAGGFLLFRFYRAHRKDLRNQVIERTAYMQGPGLSDRARAAVPMPDDVRRSGVVELEIGAVAAQAVVIFILGLIVTIFGWILMPFGIGLMALSVLLAARLVGHRKALEWDMTSVTAHHLLGTITMQWADVRDVDVAKADIFDFGTLARSGARKNIVISGAVNRLGRRTRLLLPLQLARLPGDEAQRVLRDLMSWQAAGLALHQDAGPLPATARFTERPPPQPEAPPDPSLFYAEPATRPAGQTIPRLFAPAATDAEHAPPQPPPPAADLTEGTGAIDRDGSDFDPDAIMAKYLRQREATRQDQARDRMDLQHQQTRSRANMPGAARGSFGRRGL